MISVRMLFGHQVRDVLWGLKCRFVAKIDDNNALWATPWGHHFTVPTLGPDELCAQSALNDIVAGIERTRPTNP